ncbi:MAG: arylsulfatase [Planctomycetota bacterium]
MCRSRKATSPSGYWVLAAVIVGVVLGKAVSAHAAESPARKPNIIFVLADDLGYGDLGCFGQKLIRTPCLDRMADEGMRFTDFYAGSTVCAPSRCVLMTGRHLGHATVRGNADKERQSLNDEDVTVAELLRGAGYATALIGKWGLGEHETPGMPTDQGFDYFFGYLNQHHAHNYYPEFLFRNKEKVPLRNVLRRNGQWYEEIGAGVADKKVDYSHDLVAEEALKFVDQNKDRPFFLYLALTIPHANNEATRLVGNGQEVPHYGIYADKDWSDPDKGQAAMITRMDGDVGRLLDRLKKHGIDQETIVLFSSDNGHHDEGGHDTDLFDPNGPLKGMKRDLYEGGIRVPTIARWPGRVAAGAKTDHVGYFGDLMATAADLAGVEPPEGLDSVSFLPTLVGQSDKQKQHDYLYWEFYEQGTKQAVRMGKWKAVRQPMLTGKIELYDLSTDLGEENDIAGEHPDLVAKMVAMMAEAHVPSPRWPVKPQQKKQK